MTGQRHETDEAAERPGETAGQRLELPSSLPRPPGELRRLENAWEPPAGLRWITAINNNIIGVYYLGTAILFFIFAGILAAMMRVQLAVPENTFVSQDLYNQLFTMHGTVMMFLFAVPAVEAAGVLLLPQMLGARDLPFPRLSAYAFWAYAIGGTVFCSSIFFGLSPSGGWFMYPPLTSESYSSGIGADFWLLGIGFIEISAIAGAIEIIVGVLRTRAPGMTLGKMPVFAWTMLIFAGMIVFAFPAIILATILLELERAFGWPFFIPKLGGDPLLWQHLFWFFGHPEVYIIFLPAAGMVSMILPTMARTPLVAYNLIVVALIATGFFSFGLWVHHMFSTGLPSMALGFFSGASMAVSLPSGVQVFAWIATIASGRLSFDTPALFVLGFLFIFVLGGLTGVMVAMVPFDWQVHDTYFIVAHLHYVLVGGMVFPLFAALYYWTPAFSRYRLDERLGKWAFWLMFVGFNVAFFTMHITGLMGMPRRVYTYPAGIGWGTSNMISTIGAVAFAAGVALVVFDLLRNFRFSITHAAGNVWRAGTLEWLPNGTYAARSVPRVTSHDPLWHDPNLARDVEAGAYYLPGTATGGRETIVTSPVEARPQYVMQMPMPGWAHVLAALGTAGFFLLLTFKLVWLSLIAGAIGLAAVLRWAWQLDPGPGAGPVDIGGGLRLPVYAAGPGSHSWWAMVVLMLVAATFYLSLVFSYLYTWTVSPDYWPRAQSLPPLELPSVSAVLLIASSALVILAGRLLPAPGRERGVIVPLLLLLGIAGLLSGLGLEVAAHWTGGLRPEASSYGALVYMVAASSGAMGLIVAIMGLFTAARHAAGLLNRERRATFDNTAVFWHYVVAQALLGLVVVHGFPRLMA